ncbi:hypothetical protein [Hyphomicrobium sp.]|uniref:hypothetical protein n=1 Tax=Hyphomicrobium sp. TaxID=82 RepID=UPI0025B8C66E|nr:hypothetical protein [Hyphomicrobium sp.]MCC7253459.1 hypothetical protein [Hyphomicrobium sp.]
MVAFLLLIGAGVAGAAAYFFLFLGDNMLASPDDFGHKSWVIYKGVAVAKPTKLEGPPGCSNKLTFDAQGAIAALGHASVKVGDKVESSVWLWSDSPATVNLYAGREGAGAWEGTATSVMLTPTPTVYTVVHEFKSSHPGAKLQLVAPAEAVELNACGAALKVLKPPQATS